MPRVLNKHSIHFRYLTMPQITANSYIVYIGRGSKWGNPFVIGVDGDRDEVLDKYEEYAEREFTEKDYEELRGKDLICYCAPKRCHGDFLIRKANKI